VLAKQREAITAARNKQKRGRRETQRTPGTRPRASRASGVMIIHGPIMLTRAPRFPQHGLSHHPKRVPPLGNRVGYVNAIVLLGDPRPHTGTMRQRLRNATLLNAAWTNSEQRFSPCRRRVGSTNEAAWAICRSRGFRLRRFVIAGQGLAKGAASAPSDTRGPSPTSGASQPLVLGNPLRIDSSPSENHWQILPFCGANSHLTY
jgi:hypothetical protein